MFSFANELGSHCFKKVWDVFLLSMLLHVKENSAPLNYVGLVCCIACQVIKICTDVRDSCNFSLLLHISFTEQVLQITLLPFFLCLSLSLCLSVPLFLSLSLLPSFTPIVPGAVNSLTVNGLNTQFSVQWAEPTVTNGVVANYYVLVYYATMTDRSLAAGRQLGGTVTATVVVGLGE